MEEIVIGRKFDDGKARWELFDLNQAEKIVQILTFGAKKYEDNNWKMLSNFKDRYYAALIRHLNLWKSGEEFDKESGKSHLWHAATNMHFLLWGQDNVYNFGNLRIGLDVDGVLADFNTHAMSKFNIQNEPNWWKYSYKYSTGEIWNVLDNDENFWMNLTPLVDPKDLKFEPTCYITARHNKEVTEKWLEKNGFPSRPVFITKDTKKHIIVEQKLDVFVDDKLEHYLDAKSTGVRAFLMDSPWNRRYDVGEDRLFYLEELEKKFYKNA